MPSSNGEAEGGAPQEGFARGNLERRAERTFFALLGLLCVVLFAQLLSYGYGRDQAIYSLVADALLRGDAPYRDAWDFKPPGIYLIYATAQMLFGSSFAAVRVLEALALTSLFGAFAIFSRRSVGTLRAGVVGASLAILAYIPLEFWYTAQPEGFGGVALAWALVCATYTAPAGSGRAGERRQLAAWAGAAALYSVAALLKPPLGGGILVSFAFVIASRRSEARASGWMRALCPPTLAFVVGGALPLLATFGYFVLVGALYDLHQALFVFAPGYTALQLAQSSPLLLLGRALHEWLFLTAPYNAVGLLALALLPVLHPRERAGIAHVLGVVAFSLLGVALQAKFFLYHYAAALPLTALLAGWGFWKLWIRVRPSPAGLLAFAAALGIIAAGVVPGLPDVHSFWKRTALRFEAHVNPALRVRYHDRLHSLGDVDAGSNRRAAAWLVANTSPDSRLFIWGFEPVIYQLAARRPASRYIYNVPQRAQWTKEASRRVLMEELAATAPEAVIIVHRDAMPRVTGNRLDSHAVLQTYPELQQLLQQDYRPARRTGDLEILLRRR